MIGFWNREEIFMGTSMKRFNEICDLLAFNKIKYTYKVVNRNSPGLFGTQRGYTGTLGEKGEYSNQYYIYVHKNDLENARFILNKR